MPLSTLSMKFCTVFGALSRYSSKMISCSPPPNSTSMIASVCTSSICSLVTLAGFASALFDFLITESGSDELDDDLLLGGGGGWFNWACAAGARSSAVERRQQESSFMGQGSGFAF